jgi:F-type H+-transporting ATPase subunit delta
MVDTRAGRIRGKVTTAQALAPDVLEKLEQNLKRMTQREVLLETKVDPALIGGVSTQLGSLLFDGSLRSQLEELRQQLSQG